MAKGDAAAALYCRECVPTWVPTPAAHKDYPPAAATREKDGETHRALAAAREKDGEAHRAIEAGREKDCKAYRPPGFAFVGYRPSREAIGKEVQALHC